MSWLLSSQLVVLVQVAGNFHPCSARIQQIRQTRQYWICVIVAKSQRKQNEQHAGENKYQTNTREIVWFYGWNSWSHFSNHWILEYSTSIRSGLQVNFSIRWAPICHYYSIEYHKPSKPSNQTIAQPKGNSFYSSFEFYFNGGSVAPSALSFSALNKPFDSELNVNNVMDDGHSKFGSQIKWPTRSRTSWRQSLLTR